MLDWRQVERREVRERIDLAFHVMDREYGVTRLLDPEGKFNRSSSSIEELWGSSISEAQHRTEAANQNVLYSEQEEMGQICHTSRCEVVVSDTTS